MSEVDYKKQLDDALAELKAAYAHIEGQQKENRGTQEMLALVLQEVGEPVIVGKEVVKRGIPAGYQILIDDNGPAEAFIFSLEKVDGTA